MISILNFKNGTLRGTNQHADVITKKLDKRIGILAGL